MSLEEDYLRVREEKQALEKELATNKELLEEAMFYTCLDMMRKIGIKGFDLLERDIEINQTKLIAKFGNIEFKEGNADKFGPYIRNYCLKYATDNLKVI